MNSVITRFAPSPTGNLHIGGIRTALINYIIAKKAKLKDSNSKFLLRIEDTDLIRSEDKFKENIINNLNWLKIHHDDKPYIQSKNIARHQEIANILLKNQKAFKCICSSEELDKKRIENRINKLKNKKLCEKCEHNKNIQSLEKDYTVRIKIPNSGKTIINDQIQGKVNVENSEIDDFILLRKNGTPTYMLSVVVDDHDMGVNLVIRGDDHLNNTFRQFFIYNNLDWPLPNYAHLPLIHGMDGQKLSKRHGAVDVSEFKNNGYLRESIINNLILLGWSPKKKEEFIEINEIINLFEIENLSKSSSIFDYDRLNFFNNYYINNDKNLNEFYDYCSSNYILNKFLDIDKEKLIRIFSKFKKNINCYKDLENICTIFYDNNIKYVENNLLTNDFKNIIIDFLLILENIDSWNIDNIEKEIKTFIDYKKIKFPLFGKPLRLVLINSEKGPSLSDIFFILGKKNSIQRIKNYINSL